MRLAERSAAAAAVHLLTAGGAVLGLVALLDIAHGRWHRAFLWMLLAVAIDGVDGALARRARAATALPSIDGALLDNLVDYLNYVVVPAFFLVEARLLPDGANLAGAAAICVASGFQFAHVEAKTRDHLFRGFPSYWNLVVPYLLVLGLDVRVNLAVVLALILLVFAPVYFVYPTRTERLRGLTLAVTAVWFVVLTVLLWRWPAPPGPLAWISLVGPAYHVALSADLTRRRDTL